MQQTDPYYWSRDVMNFNAQQQALGQGKGMTPEAISSMVGANFRAQQDNLVTQTNLKLQKQAMTNQRIDASINQGQQSQAARSGAYQGATSLAVNTPLIYAAGKTAGFWGAAAPTATTAGTAAAGTSGATAVGTGSVAGQAIATGAGDAAVTGSTAAAAEGVSALGVGAAGVAGWGGYELGSHLIHGKYSEAAGVGGAIAAGAAIGSVIPGIGTAIGAAVGGVVGLIEAGSIICTELNRQGYISDSMLRASSSWVMKHGDREAYIGYLIFATPIVKRMKNSKLVTLLALPYGKTMCRECASRSNPQKYKSTVVSRTVYKVSEILFKQIYRNHVAQEVAHA